MRILDKSFLALLFGTLLTGNAQAVTIPIALFNTGQNLADGSVDPHYVLTVNPSNTGTNAIVQDSTAFPIASGPWVADTATARWIGPAFNTGGAAGGTYTYEMTFTLPTFAQLSTATISGSWAFDDGGGVGGILLNGAAVSPAIGANPGFGSLTSFTIPAGNAFVVGTNTLDFIGTNGGNGFTGLLVSGISGTVGVPEPSSIILCALGAVGLVVVARRRRKA